MHANLRIALAAATLVAAVPAAGIASAHEGKGKGHDNKPAKRCDRGKGYEAKGLLAAGSSLEQVAGAGTVRRGDDRFSGTVVVQVKQGNKRGRQERGLTSYVVTNVRALGTVAADDPLPPVGTRVQVVGKLAKPCAPAPTTPTPSPTPAPTATPEPSPTATPDPVASQLRSDDPAADYPAGTTDPTADDPTGTTDPGADAPKVSAAVIRLVVFKPGRQRPEKVRGDDGEDRRGDRPRGDDAPCPPDGARQSFDDDENEAEAAGEDRAECPVAAPVVDDDVAEDDEGDDDRQPGERGPRGPRR